jgi:hypothetical protein
MNKSNNQVDFVKIYNTTMTTDAFSILVSGLLLISVLIFTYGFNPIFLMLFASYIVSAYKVNCMIVGSCNLYAKIISIATSIAVIFMIIDKEILNKLKNKLLN